MKLLKKEHYNFKSYRVPNNFKNAFLKINEWFTFCNLTNDRFLVLINVLKEKLLLIDSKINENATCFVTKIVVKHHENIIKMW